MSVVVERGEEPGWTVALLLIGGLAALLAGLVMPAFSVRTLFIGEDTFSILDGIIAFFEDGQPYLGSLLLVLSILFPVAKILFGLLAIVFFRAGSPRLRVFLDILSTLSKWSMTDVFLLSLIVLVLDGRLLTTADLLPGTGVFAAGIILSGLGIWWLERIARRSLRRAGAPD